MGIDDIIETEPMYAGHLEDAHTRRRHEERMRARTANGRVNVTATDGGAMTAEREPQNSLSFGGAEMSFSQTETLILGILLVNTAMTAGLLFAVLME